MREKNKTTEQNFWEESTYQTGSTCPPKEHGSTLVLILCLLVFLCGTATTLGMVKIHLARQLGEEAELEEIPVSFTRTAAQTAQGNLPLGFTGQEVSTFWQEYNDLPQGIYITQVDLFSDAAAKGLEPGDILLSMDGVRITSTDAFNSQLSTYEAGDSVTLTVYQSGKQVSLNLIFH